MTASAAAPAPAPDRVPAADVRMGFNWIAARPSMDRCVVEGAAIGPRECAVDRILVRHFARSDADGFAAFIAQHDGQRNLYVVLNLLSHALVGSTRRAKSTDVPRHETLLLDIDPCHDDLPPGRALLASIAMVPRVVALSHEGERPLLLDSGRGGQIWFRPVGAPRETWDQIRADFADLLVCYQCRLDATHDAVRLARVPGTVNSRTRRIARIIRIPSKLPRHLAETLSGRRHDLDDSSRSGFEMAAADALADFGFLQEEVEVLLAAYPYGRGPTEHPSSRGTTARKAVEGRGDGAGRSNGAKRTAPDGREPHAAGNGSTVSTTAWPTPPADEAFHGLAGEVVNVLDPYTEADPVGVLLQFLCVFGNVVGRSPHFMVGATRHAVNLFVLVVGKTAKSRKGTALAEVRRIFQPADAEWERLRIVSGLSSGEGLIHQVRDRREEQCDSGERVCVDSGVKDKRLLVLESEFASPLRRMEREGNTLSEVLRCAWDGLPLGTLIKRSPDRAQTSHISVIGHTTEPDLLRYLSATEQANGFGNRFLFGCVQRSKILPEGGVLPGTKFKGLVEKINTAVEFAYNGGEMRRDLQARTVWAAVYPQLSQDVPGLFGALTARAEAIVLRLSMLYVLLDQSAEIRPAHINAALAVWEFSEASVRYLFGDSLGDLTADEIFRALCDNPAGLTRTEIGALFSRHKPSAEIDRGLAVLQRLARVQVVYEQTDGRATERWVHAQ